MSANIEPLRPAQIVARRVKEARKSRNWSQAKLAEELTRLGYVKSRSTLTKLEGGDYRNVSVDDVFAICAAVGTDPVHLLSPLNDEAPVQVTSNVQLPAWQFRAWIRGQHRPPMLPDVDYRQVPTGELEAQIEKWLARGMAPLAYALVKDKLAETARQMAAEMQTPPPEGGTNGNRY
jgi:transcriptional regulator with XRE-family HTH domain